MMDLGLEFPLLLTPACCPAGDSRLLRASFQVILHRGGFLSTARVYEGQLGSVDGVKSRSLWGPFAMKIGSALVQLARSEAF
jgi:hypothetical protein